MQAVRFTDHGSRAVIDYGDVPDPEPGPGEVLVDVKAGALNHLDVWVRRGLPGLDLELPHVPGSDGAGVVAEVGPDVDRFDVGDRVALLAARWCDACEHCRAGDRALCERFHVIGEHVPGVHAEYAAVPAENLTPVPEGVDWATAAAAPLVFQTAWRMLVTRAEVRPGDDILVHGATGGVGHAAVQIAKHAGAAVYATGGSDEKLDAVADLGADVCIDYERESFKDVIREATDGRGVDVVVDHVGEATWADSLKCLVRGGTLVTCGATTGGTPETNVRRVFWNHLNVLGSTMATPGEAEDVLELVWSGELAPAIRAELPMSETAEGHRLLEVREGVGKVVVVPDSER
ncbi:MAG: zinc-binding dehydrogenase [Halobacteriales archaeon]